MEWVEKIFSWRRKNRQEGVSSQTTSVGGGGGGALQGDEEGPNEEKGLDEEAFHGSDDTKEDVISDDDDDDDDVTDKRKEEEDDADSAHISEMEDDAVVVSDDDNIDESRIVDAKTAPTGGAFQEEEGPDEEDSQGRDLKADGEQEIIRVVSEDDNDKKDERPIQQEVRSIDDSRDELSDLGSNENHGESQENVPHDFGYGPLKISWTWSFPDVVHRLHNQSIWKTSEYVNGTKNWSERFLKRFGEGFAEWEHSTALYAVLYHFSLHYDGEIKEIYATSYWFIVLIITLFLVSMLLWRRKKRSKSPNRRSISEPRMGGMEILRTTRERSSTFDFFGVSMRDRRHSIDSVDGFRDRSDSGPTEIRRKRLGSMDLYGTRKESTKSIFSEANPANRHSTSQDIMSDDFISSHMEDEEGYLYDEFGLVTLSVHVEYYGPKITTLKYSTWTPPTSWVEASRRIIPQDIMLKLQRDLILDVKKACIEVREPKSSGKWGFSLPVQNISMHVTPPVEGGVISLYVKGSSKEDWMEHTFELASDAAQFQLDLLGYQVLGRTLFHMFEALSLVHLGSLAYDGQEFVLHDKKIEESETEENPNEGREAGHGCVAWDDALRALSSIPTIRIALERLWIKHRRSEQFGEGKKGNANSSKEESSKDGLLVESYLNKRLLLGPVDFFRLFVPALPETALPQSESSRARMEQLLSWRKRAARAAVLIRAYTMSHRVVNRGWKLSYPVHDNPEVKLTKRIAFDDNEDNHRRDINAKNEYYEASVSRDVLCHVRPFDYFRQNTIKDKFSKRRLVLSPYQAYSLVESHMFKIPQDDPDDNRLVPSRDPVATFPSLKTLISQNPDLDFFVASFYSKNSVTVLCFVRTLPKGIDPQFDNVMDRFTYGGIALREKKVHLMLQLGHSLAQSFAGQALLWILSLLFRLTQKGRESPLGVEATRGRTKFPAIRVADFAEMYHFGGAMQTDSNLPENYVSMNLNFSSKFMPNLISRMLFSRLEEGMRDRIEDFTFVLEGDQEDELPERALCTIRMVNVDTQVVAKDVLFHALPLPKQEDSSHTGPKQEEGKLDFTKWMTNSIYDVSKVAGTPLRGSFTGDVADGIQVQIDKMDFDNDTDMLELVDSNDSLEIAANEVTKLLKDVEMPLRKYEKIESGMQAATHDSDIDEIAYMQVLKRVSRSDVKRFVQAANFDIKGAAVRIIQTVAWRERTFPIDIRKCRIELQNGQFFHQGFDREKNPIFYFRNVCLGPWRRDFDATLSAVMYRFDRSLTEFCKSKPDTRCTLIVLMGQPICKTHHDGVDASMNSVAEKASEDPGADDVGNDGAEEDESLSNDNDATPFMNATNNPRILQSESWRKHTNRELIEKFVHLFSSHYPERLSKVLVVTGKGKNFYYKTIVRGRFAMKKLIGSPETRNKVIFIRNTFELTEYVDENQLTSIVGGFTQIGPGAFESSR